MYVCMYVCMYVRRMYVCKIDLQRILVSGTVGAKVLSNFQCLGALLIWIMVTQGPVVLAAGLGKVGCISVVVFVLFSSALTSQFFSLHMGGQLDMSTM